MGQLRKDKSAWSAKVCLRYGTDFAYLVKRRDLRTSQYVNGLDMLDIIPTRDLGLEPLPSCRMRGFSDEVSIQPDALA